MDVVGDSGRHNDWEADRQCPLLSQCLGKTGINIKSLERGDLNAKQHPTFSLLTGLLIPQWTGSILPTVFPIYIHTLPDTHTLTGSHYQTMIEG